MINLHMYDEIGFPLTLSHVQSSPAEMLLEKLKEWLFKNNPVCLRHPHGFYVMPLSLTEVEEWRLHVWPNDKRPIVGMPAFIHTHDRCVESKVLQGKLRNIQYDVQEDEVHGLPLYQVYYGGSRYDSQTSNALSRTSSLVTAKIRSRDLIEENGSYSIEAHVFHEAIVQDGIVTATLVCMHGRKPGTVKVVGLEGYGSRIEFTRTMHRASEFFQLLK